jgi:hypothetical protein
MENKVFTENILESMKKSAGQCWWWQAQFKGFADGI